MTSMTYEYSRNASDLKRVETTKTSALLAEDTCPRNMEHPSRQTCPQLHPTSHRTSPIFGNLLW